MTFRFFSILLSSSISLLLFVLFRFRNGIALQSVCVFLFVLFFILSLKLYTKYNVRDSSLINFYTLNGRMHFALFIFFVCLFCCCIHHHQKSFINFIRKISFKILEWGLNMIQKVNQIDMEWRFYSKFYYY